MSARPNTRAMEKRVLRAARALLPQVKRGRLQADFDQQWWVTDLDSGAQWSAIDATGPNTEDGFCFEQVTQGEES